MGFDIEILSDALVDNAKEIINLMKTFVNRLGFDSDEKSKEWVSSALAVYAATKNMTIYNRDYMSSKKSKIEGIMIHSTGNPGMSANDFIEQYYGGYYEDKDFNMSAHAVIDCSGKVYHTLPWNKVSSHSEGSYDNYISIVLCEPEAVSNDSTNEAIERVFASAVELCALLCIVFHLDPEGTRITGGYNIVIGHNEAILAGEFHDPEEFWNMMNRNHSMNNFRTKVVAKIKESSNSVESSAIMLYKLLCDV